MVEKIVSDNGDGETLEKCMQFLEGIGIPVKCRRITEDCFLPGLLIHDGAVIVDREQLLFPGDILHEAGHIAVVPSDERPALNAAMIRERATRDAEEMMAIAWSFAACIHLGLDPYFVFHDDGYKGGGSYIADNFMQKKYFGLPMLQWIGLSADEKKAAEMNVQPFPHMIKWLRD